MSYRAIIAFQPLITIINISECDLWVTKLITFDHLGN
jgi:hypothetical protein